MCSFRQHWSWALIALVVWSGCGLAVAGFIRHDRDAAEYEKQGNDPAFASVGSVTFSWYSGQEGVASAVLIAPQWALTAGHVAAGTDLEHQTYIFGEERLRAAQRVLHPSFEELDAKGDLACMAAGADLALVQLERPVETVLPAVRYRGSGEVGRTMTKVGYGVIGDGASGPVRPFVQRRRGGHNMIDAAGGQFGQLEVSSRVLLFDFDHPQDETLNRLGSPTPLDLEIGGSPGDSGCGWFIKDGGQWQLVAIMSGPIPPSGDPDDGVPSRYGAVVAGIRVSTANDWIDSVISSTKSPDNEP